MRERLSRERERVEKGYFDMNDLDETKIAPLLQQQGLLEWDILFLSYPLHRGNG